MSIAYRYHRPAMHLEFYTAAERLNAPPPPDIQPEMARDLTTISRDETIPFAEGDVDIRGFALNTPQGNMLGTVHGFLADTSHGIIPYAYVMTNDHRMLAIPTNQVTIYPEQRILTLEGGIEALRDAPEAKMNAGDAQSADLYWRSYRRRNAA